LHIEWSTDVVRLLDAGLEQQCLIGVSAAGAGDDEGGASRYRGRVVDGRVLAAAGQHEGAVAGPGTCLLVGTTRSLIGK
jgi:hypothetical protein